jgi:hypothetical protein
MGSLWPGSSLGVVGVVGAALWLVAVASLTSY